jgi:hypothetical protein
MSSNAWMVGLYALRVALSRRGRLLPALGSDGGMNQCLEEGEKLTRWRLDITAKSCLRQLRAQMKNGQGRRRSELGGCGVGL